MSTNEIEYTYLDASRTECTGVYTGSRETAIAAAAEHLAAYRQGGEYRYIAKDTGETYEVTADELAELGAGLIEEPNGDCYSLWCTWAGSLIS